MRIVAASVDDSISWGEQGQGRWDIREDQSERSPLTFTSWDESKVVILGTGCNPSCATLSSFACDDARLECASVHAYVLRLGFFGVGERRIEARTADGALYDAVVFPITPAD